MPLRFVNLKRPFVMKSQFNIFIKERDEIEISVASWALTSLILGFKVNT